MNERRCHLTGHEIDGRMWPNGAHSCRCLSILIMGITAGTFGTVAVLVALGIL